jgi:transcriptional regulator with XRE-family HTH domain
MIGDRLRLIRQEKNLSQGDLEQRTGLSRCYLSRIENGHTIPSIDTLEKLSSALDTPLYQLFYEGGNSPRPLVLPRRGKNPTGEWGVSGKWANFLHRLQLLLGQMEEDDRKLLLGVALKMARNKR